MKKIRLLSAFLTVVMVFGMLPAVQVAAEDELVPGYDYEEGETTIDYLTQSFATAEDKLTTMTKYLSKGDFELYVEPISGEIAYVNTKTGQILLSNPYDVAHPAAASANTIRNKLLSQIIIKYVDNGSEIEMNSFVEACQRGQITVKKIKNGVRVEYAMGKMETRKLIPKQIKKERFEELILANIPEGAEKLRLMAYYTLQDAEDPALTERGRREILANFPICSKMAIYTFDTSAGERDQERVENTIKKYCPEYTFETLAEDHLITNYTGEDKAPVLFRLSLEYTLDEDGNLDVRLPANGIRFDESSYQLTSVSMLPWFGAGSSYFNGYTFIPDGSGALVRFEDVRSKPVSITGKIYGQDQSYQVVTGQNREIMRLPVFGLVESEAFNAPVLTEEQLAAGILIADPGYKQPTGFLAILEEGDSLADITTEHGGNQHKYNGVYTTFYPRPKDTYNLAEAISVGSNATYTVVSERKYTGSYRTKYIMLTSQKEAEEAELDSYYDTSYVGMAKAYRDYLIENGTLTEITDTKEDLPLYIESFGALNTIEKVLSMPVKVLKPLTTFEDLKVMYNRLAEAGITNVNYKLTGYANGGMNDTAPYHVKFEKAVGGDKGFTEFVSYAEEKGIGVYPDFDFANVGMFDSFDGISNKKHLIKTMDGRYTTKRFYDSTLQSFEIGYSLAISPSVYGYLFDNFSEEFSALKPSGVSLSTLGTDLNSDFDKEDPYNREDSKALTTELLADMSNVYGNVMVDGGNVYSVEYADHIIAAPLDSSRYSSASEAVPFLGMVFHGSVNFAGTAINMAGDTQYELLKAIENGSNLYFTLSMQNTSLLKEDTEFNKFYSVSFDIWYDEVVELYGTLNDAIGDLQTSQIVDHEFLIGERVPTAEELEADKEAIEKAEAEKAEADRIAAEKAEREALLAERLEALYGTDSKKDNNKVPAVVVGGEEESDAYKYTKYTTDSGLVKVTYDGGKAFILNYNNFGVDVVVDGETYFVDALNFVVAK